MMQLSYINKRGETVLVEITNHARRRFVERWRHVFPNKPFPGDVDDVIAQWFAKAQRMNADSRIFRTRLRRHGKDTLYFSASPFVFVVQSASLRTVELGTPETRKCNKMPAARTTFPLPQATPVVVSDTISQPTRFRFRLVAMVLNEQGDIKTICLGRCEQELTEEEVWKLGEDEAFRGETLRSFRDQFPEWTLLAVFARTGKNGPLIPLIDLNPDID